MGRIFLRYFCRLMALFCDLGLRSGDPVPLSLAPAVVGRLPDLCITP